MVQMMKSNYFNYKRLEILLTFLLIPLAYSSIDMPVITVSFIFFPAIIADIFYYENKSRSNRCFVSLPLTGKTIVHARYIYFLFFFMLIVLFQWGTAYGIDWITGEADYLYTWKIAITVFLFGLVITALTLPLFYLFKSFYSAIITTGILIFILFYQSLDPLVTVLNMGDYIIFNHVDYGFPLLVEAYVPFCPYITLLIIALVLYYLSSKLSVVFFNRKDK